MALTTQEKKRAAKKFMRSAFQAEARIDQTVIKDTIDAIDTWLAAGNLSSLQAAMPAAFKSNADATQKAQLVSAVLRVMAGDT